MEKSGHASNNRVFASSAFLASTAMAVLMVTVFVVIARSDESKFRVYSPVDYGAAVSGTSMGSPSAPVTFVVYSDFQCVLCQQFALTTEVELRKVYIETGKVQIVFKHFVVHGNESTLAAEASEAAAEQNKFWPFHDLLMQARASPNVADLGIDKLDTIARQADLDIVEFHSSLTSGKYKEEVLSDSKEGKMLGVIGTPTFFVNGNKSSGSPDFQFFQSLIDKLLAEGGN